MSELRQLHQSLRVSKVQELKDNRFLVIRDTPRDAAILQSDNKMKACLGQNVSASLPKAYQTAKEASKTLMVKGGGGGQGGYQSVTKGFQRIPGPK